MTTLAVTTLLLLASACYLESASVLDLSRKYDRSPRNGLGIYGGDVLNSTVPYFAMLRSRVKFYIPCGAGVIVHKQHVLTTGNCATEMIKNKLHNHEVEVGTYDFTVEGDTYRIEKVTIHPKFIINFLPDKILWDYDIAVIKLKKPIKFNDDVQPIKMADPGFVLKVGDRVVSYGMGETADMIIPMQLHRVSVPCFDHKKCRMIYHQAHLNVTERFFCAGGEAGKATVSGDYGGPVVYNNDTLVGLNSYCLYPFGMEGFPSGYLNISVVRPFIDSVIKMEE